MNQLPIPIKAIMSLIVAGVLFLSGAVFVQMSAPVQQPEKQNFGAAFTPAQIPQTTLSGAGVTSSANTVQLVSFATRDGRAVIMSMLGSIGYATLEPGSSKEEIISFTGITQNTNGTALLTGVSRGLDFVSPYSASTTLAKSHAGGGIFIISNTAPFYGQQFALIGNPEAVTGLWTFASTSMPGYDVSPSNAQWAVAQGTAFVNLDKLNATFVAGCANASETQNGCAELATGREAASSTLVGGTGARLVLPASLATSSPWSSSTSTIVMTQLDGKINPLFIATSSNYTYTWNASSTFAGILNLFGTTSIAANIALGKGLCLNGVCYTAPATQGSAGNVLQNNGSGTLSWGTTPRYSSIGSTFNIGAGTAGFGTSTGITIPANTLTSSSTIEVHGNFNSTNGASGAHAGTIFLRTSNGVTLGSCGWSIPANLGVQGMYFITVSATSTTASQQTLFEAMFIQTVGTISSSAQQACDGVSYTGLNFSQAQTLVLVVQSNDTNGNNTILGNSQFVVNP